MTDRDAANTGDLAPGGSPAEPSAVSHDPDDALRQIAGRLSQRLVHQLAELIGLVDL